MISGPALISDEVAFAGRDVPGFFESRHALGGELRAFPGADVVRTEFFPENIQSTAAIHSGSAFQNRIVQADDVACRRSDGNRLRRRRRLLARQVDGGEGVFRARNDKPRWAMISIRRRKLKPQSVR